MRYSASLSRGANPPARTWLRCFCGLPAVFLVAVSMAATQTWAQSDISDNIDVELLYPAELNAGGAFTVYARFSNNSDTAINVPRLAGYWSVNNHTVHYASTLCYDDCNLSGSSVIEPGAQALIRLADLYFRGEQFASGSVLISASAFQTTTMAGESLIIGDPVSGTITVNVPAGIDTENELVTVVPARGELELNDLLEAGDQLILHDSNTQSDWLRFNASADLSETQLYQALSTDGALAGFRIASITEVETLILNHLHSKGLAAQAGDLYYNPNAELLPAIAELVELLQPTSPEFVSARQTMGIVSDRLPRASDGQIRYRTVTLEGSEPTAGGSLTLPQGASLGSPTRQEWNRLWSHRAGVWLVRGTVAEPSRPATRASFYDRELLIPNVAIDGNHYQVHLRLLSHNPERFQVTSMNVADALAYADPFNASNGVITLTGAELIEGDSRSTYDVTLSLMPGTEPPVFEVISISPGFVKGGPGGYLLPASAGVR